MRFFTFHLMPFNKLPEDFEEKYETAWTTVPNSLYDPVYGHELYNRFLDELIYAEEIGFDGVCVNEHHQSAYGHMPSPNLMGSILARQTKRVKIAVIGNALPFYDPPTRVAEEFAMIDVISGGRLIAGMVVGGGPEYYSFSMNPTYARSKYQEALDLIVRAWTEPGPFEHYGEHWKLRHVNPWPTPFQKPHPPIWIPGAGSKETIELVAERRYSYMGIPYFHKSFFKKNFDMFRKACQKNGYKAHEEQTGWLVPIYVAETDEQAWAEYEKHLFFFIKKLLKGLVVFPPGYSSPKSIARIGIALKQFLGNVTTREEIEEGGYAMVGSPETVREKMKDYVQDFGVGNVLGLFQIGTLPADLTKKNMTLFAEQVLPYLRKELGEPATDEELSQALAAN
ncbi:LLM class flavin-dependent oxidoreductase [Rubinisphaera sp.]|uniref:LLM class flavin-dependent oxidoreductase n=1 Tax=Rubinisphaera sp. TaxID=2024857 RepID=UPI000C10CF26|nr:LLM class flavin-dependent oxidoreductase [Rubinisphaera sp.]MBV10955.1 LLM class flavin-dependent oxidoreductase [Rubinisphaera sp.]